MRYYELFGEIVLVGKIMKRSAIFLPFLFVLASLLQLFYIATIAVSPGQVLRPLITLWGLLLLLLHPFNWLLRDWNWTGMFLTIFVLAFFFSSEFFSTMILSILVVLLIWLIFGRLYMVKFRLQHLVNLLTGVGWFFVCYSLCLTGIVLAKVPWKNYIDSVNEVREYSLGDFSSLTSKHDIYYIILDDYARSDVLQELFGYDNSEFITSLEELGFIVPTDYYSNYPMTHLSVSATLNMEYLQELAPGLERSHSRWLMKPFIDHGRVRTFLEERGYQTISISSNWTITENSTTDIYYHPYPVMLSDFEGFVLGSTPSRIFGHFLQKIASVRSVMSQQKIVIYGFETLASIPEIPGPKFVFAHIISPHPPFVFDKDGNTVDVPYTFNFKDGNEYPGTPVAYKEGYINQLQFINRRLQETLSTILENSKTAPIIIIQADHGSGLMTDFTSPNNTCIKERFSPFSAYFLPDINDPLFLTDVSAVNTFRIVFNEYFEAELPLLENRQYFYRNQISSYDFLDVTDRVNDSCD